MQPKHSMIISFEFPDQPIDLVVDLLDNPGVQAWARCFSNGYKTQANIHDHLYVFETNFKLLNKLYQQIAELLEQLAHLDIMYQGPDTVEFDIKNSDNIHHWLNALHRFFTHNQAACNQRCFGNNLDYSAASTLLHELNECIHTIEQYVPRGPADNPVSTLSDIKLYHPTNSGTSAWLDLNDYRQYHSQHHYDVILTSEILGKTIIQSYLDLDDPNDWDTSGHYVSAGGIQICIDSTRQTIYQSQSFQNWLTKYGVDPAAVNYDYPLGNIQNKNSAEWHKLVEFFNTVPDAKLKVTYHSQ
jgi:hypothetical protein